MPTTNRTPMSPLRKTALAAGLLYLATFVFSIPALAFYDGVLHNADFVNGAGSSTGVLWGAIFEIITALTGIGTAVVLYRVLRQHGPTGAVGFVAFTLTGSEKSGGQKFFLGIPIGVIGLFVGQAAFVTLFHTGVKPIIDPVTNVMGYTTGGQLNTGHLVWDIFVGLVGCAIVAAPFAALLRTQRAGAGATAPNANVG